MYWLDFQFPSDLAALIMIAWKISGNMASSRNEISNARLSTDLGTDVRQVPCCAVKGDI
jgi:hypothetical protein